METVINALVNAIGWSIIHSIWQGAALYILLLAFYLVNPKMSAKTKHNMAFMAMVAMFLLFAQSFYSEFTKWLELGTSLSVVNLALINYTGNITEVPSLLFDGARKSIPFIVSIYSVGLILQVGYLFMGYRKIQFIKKQGITALPIDLDQKFIALSKTLGINRVVRFVNSSMVSVPMVVGYFKPLVLLPMSVLTHFEPQQLEAIIIHELSHVRRNDYLINILKVSIETILFFNPFVWLCGRIVSTERENACDDLVVEITGSPLSYAMTLLELEKIKLQKNLFSMAIAGKKHHLLNRIKRITDMKTNTFNLKVQLVAILVTIAGISSLAWIPVSQKAVAAGKKEKISLSVKPKLEFTYATDPADTTKKKIKIIVEDEKGNKKEYKSVAEMPKDVRAEFMVQNRQGFTVAFDSTHFNILNRFAIDTAHFIGARSFKIDTANFIARSNAKMDSLFFAKHPIITRGYNMARLDSDRMIYSANPITKVRVNGKDVFASPGIFTAVPFNAEKVKTILDLDKFQYSPKMTPEMLENWKKQLNNGEVKKNLEQLQKQLNSPEYKKQVEEINRNIDDLIKKLKSPEYQEQLKKDATQQKLNYRNRQPNAVTVYGNAITTRDTARLVRGINRSDRNEIRVEKDHIITIGTPNEQVIDVKKDKLNEIQVILKNDVKATPALPEVTITPAEKK